MNVSPLFGRVVGIIVSGAFVAGASGDWPNFRGPNHDGISREPDLKFEWKSPLPLVWEREVGSAFSSFACVGDRVYTCGTQDKQQVLFCLNADTGAVLWQKPFEPELVERQGGDGTRSTPTISDGRVYILGGHGSLVCFDAAGGEEVWRRQFNSKPTWFYSGSVLVEGDLAIVSAGGSDGSLAAFDRKSGREVWKCGSDPVGYATPYPFTFNGRRCVAAFLGKCALIAEAATGREVWRMPWQTDWDVNASSPLFHDGYLFFSSGYRHGCILLKLKADGDKLASETVWQSTVLRNKFQSCVLHEGHLYTSDETGLKCVEFLTGKEKWNHRRMKHGTVVLADGHLFVLSENGELLIAPATPAEFKPKTRAEILSGRCWTVPVLHRGRLYARNLKRLVCFALRG